MTRTTYTIIALAVLVVVLVGISVARSPAVDEAAIAPVGEEQTAANLKTTTQDGVTFTYPEQLSTTYMRATDWPPKITVSSAPLTCEEGETEVGRTRSFSSGGQAYCVTTLSEGAAGSMYTDYAYETLQGGKLVALTFTIRSTQCGNYEEPDRTECEQERNSFDVDVLATRMISSITTN
jgi:hypothetical protein